MAVNETIIGFPIEAVGTLVNVIAALGGILFIYLVFSVLNFIWNRKKNSNLQMINEKLDEVINLLKEKNNSGKNKKNKK